MTDDGDVDVRLRLPTPQCAPNFAFLMAADARSAVRRLPEVREVTVVLEDHYTGEEINEAVGARRGVRGGVPRRDGRGDLDALRELFQRKALLARQARVCQALLAAGRARGGRRAARGGPARHGGRGAGRGAARRARPAARRGRPGARGRRRGAAHRGELRKWLRRAGW